MIDTPKNVRQVGEVDVSHKIFVEDYVITYTKELAEELREEGTCEGKTAILLGHKKIADNDVKTYINGMVIIDSFDVSKDNIFSNELWSSIYEIIKTYYEDEEVIGWLYIGSNTDASKDKRLLGIHTGNFLGKNLVFMYYNSDEREEEFFDYMNNSFLKRKGFYIYYQRNDTMHNYMVAMSRQKSSEKDCDDHVVKDVRDILNKHQEKYESRKMMKSVYAASMFVAAMALLVGTTVIYNFNNDGKTLPVAAIETSQPEQLQTNEQQMFTEAPAEMVMSLPTEVPVEVASAAVPTEAPIETSSAAVPTEVPIETSSAAVPTEVPAEIAEAVVTEAPTEVPTKVSQDEQAEQTITQVKSNDKMHSFYIVKAGDTLGKISEQIYNSIYYIEEIKQLNSIDNEDSIYAGQKLWLPDR